MGERSGATVRERLGGREWSGGSGRSGLESAAYSLPENGVVAANSGSNNRSMSLDASIAAAKGADTSQECAVDGCAHPFAPLLHSRGLRPTRQRLAVYAALRATAGHPTVEELHRLVDDPGHPIALATVYNTLQALADAGLCRAIPTREGSRWDSGMHQHVHVRRENAAEVLDVPGDLGARILASVPPALLAEVERRMGVRIESLSISLNISE